MIHYTMYQNSGNLSQPIWDLDLPISGGCIDGDSLLDLLNYFQLDTGTKRSWTVSDTKFAVTPDGMIMTNYVVVVPVIVSQLDK